MRRHVEVGADASGRREEQRATGLAFPVPADPRRYEVVQPVEGVRAGDENRAPGGQVDDIHRSGRIAVVEAPRTLLVTNDFPPRVGGVQRTLHALVEQFPADRIAVLAPRWEGWRAIDEAA